LLCRFSHLRVSIEGSTFTALSSELQGSLPTDRTLFPGECTGLLTHGEQFRQNTRRDTTGRSSAGTTNHRSRDECFPQARLAPFDDPFAFAQVQAFNSYLCSTLHVAHAHRMRWADDPSAIREMQRKVPEAVGPATT
jgi:hypothetical protein